MNNMFYLLEDNKIINSKDYWEYAIGIDKDGKTCYRVEIKKQSENVFDLIEIGDLVKYERYDDDKFYTEEVFGIINTGKFIEVETTTAFVGEESFLAIYKLDEKGNYIKVWEKKGEIENE